MQQIEPARCKGSASKMHFPLLVEEKIDGHRALLHGETGDPRAFMTSRRISVKTNLFAENGLNTPHIIEAFHNFIGERDFGYTVLDGEIVVPGYAFETVQKITGSLPENAVAWQEANAKAHLLAFDVLFFDGRDIRDWPLEERRAVLRDILWSMECPFIHSPQELVCDTKAEVDALYSKIIAQGGEGLVVKDLRSRYGTGWAKMKLAETYDVVVVGYQPGKLKYQHMVGAVVFGVPSTTGPDYEVLGKCSGMEDGNCEWLKESGLARGEGPSWIPAAPNEEGAWLEPLEEEQPVGSRAWFTLLEDMLLGQVMEVKGNGLTAHGNIRHPQFVRMRPDKPASACVAPTKEKT